MISKTLRCAHRSLYVRVGPHVFWPKVLFYKKLSVCLQVRKRDHQSVARYMRSEHTTAGRPTQSRNAFWFAVMCESRVFRDTVRVKQRLRSPGADEEASRTMTIYTLGASGDSCAP